ncbi:MAG: FUSC family protein, partial [Acetobacteraceae bacterium]
MPRAPADLARLPLRFDPRAASLAEGVRAALSVAVIVAAGILLHQPLAAVAGLGALLTCLCDPGGPLRTRVGPLLGFAVLGAAVAGGFGLALSGGILVALPLSALAIFAGSFARIFGQAGLLMGNLLTVVVIIGLDLPLTPAAAATVAGLFLAGGVWATLLTLAIWRIHPYGPMRRALAATYRALARLVGDLQAVLAESMPALLAPSPAEPVPAAASPTASSAATSSPAAPFLATSSPSAPSAAAPSTVLPALLPPAPAPSAGAGEARWAAHARTFRRAAREAIEAARATLVGTLRARGPASRRANDALIRLEAADQVFGALIALSDTLEQEADPVASAAAAPALRRLRALLVTLATAIETDRFARSDRLVRSLDALERGLAERARNDRVRGLFATIAECLRIALTLVTPAGAPIAPGGANAPGPGVWRRAIETLRANLDHRSLPLRHALRAALAAVPALGFTLAHPTPYGHWLTITLVLTMQPYFGLTWLRALERIGGTVAGGLIAAALALVLHGPVAIVAALFPLAVLSLSLRTVSYALFITTLTPMIVLLVELDLPGTGELTIAFMRALYTVAGGLLAVACSLVLWPSFEPARVDGEARAAIAAHARYGETLLAALADDACWPDVEAARRAAGLASNNLEASLARVLLEPRRARSVRFESVLAIDAALRRIAGRLLALQYDPDAPGLGSATLRAWRGWLAAGLSAALGAPLPPPPPTPAQGTAAT